MEEFFPEPPGGAFFGHAEGVGANAGADGAREEDEEGAGDEGLGGEDGFLGVCVCECECIFFVGGGLGGTVEDFPDEGGEGHVGGGGDEHGDDANGHVAFFVGDGFFPEAGEGVLVAGGEFFLFG